MEVNNRTYNVDKYRINIMEEPEKAIVELEHPDYGNSYHIIGFNSEDMPWWSATDEEWEEYYKAVRKAIEERFNHSRYYHTVKITLEYVVDGKVYRKEI